MAFLKIKPIIFVLCFFSLGFTCVYAASPPVRIKDIAHILEARDNQLMGFGLVVGLQNTGDKTQNGFTQIALTNLMSRMGIIPQGVDFKSRNTAAVMVTANIPPFAKPGQKIDVTVSSVGDAVSLQAGTLLLTPLQGIDDQVYAVAQGSLVVGIEPYAPSLPYVRQRQATSGRISSGGIIEKEIQVNLEGKEFLSVVLNEPDFTTANRVVNAVRRAGFDASAKDAGLITIPLGGEEELIAVIAKVENLKVVPDAIAKIVINERTGTIVIGENVVIEAVAVSYGGIEVQIGDIMLFTENTPGGSDQEDTYHRARTKAHVEKSDKNLKAVNAGATLSALVRSLNAIGASPKDLIAILQAMKKAGAIKAELEII